MLKLNLTSQFKRDLKLCRKRNYNINQLCTIVNTLRIPAPLPLKNKDHDLKGNYIGRQPPDQRKEAGAMVTYSDLFTFVIMLCAVMTLVINIKRKK